VRAVNGTGTSARHLLLGVVAALAVGAAVVFGIGRVAGYSELRGALRGARYPWLAVCVLGQVAVFAGYAGALRSAVTADGGIALPVRMSVQVVLASFAATQLFAFGGIGGLAVIYWTMRRAKFDREASVVRLIGLNTAVYFVFGVMAFGAALAALVTSTAPLGMTVPWLVAFPAVLAAARWFTQEKRAARVTAPSPAKFRRLLGIGVAAAVWVRRALTARGQRPMFTWAACYWAGDLVSLWAALHAFGAQPPVAALVVVYATGYLAQSLPIPFIATGGVDAATTFLLHAVGVPLETALVGVAAHRVFAFWMPVVPGALYALRLPRMKLAEV
jgi:uncharacterized membrane protein YbhN (UPF0104 family)